MKGARERWGSRIAFVAFALVLCYWGALGFAHARALARGGEEAARLASSNGESVARLAAMPDSQIHFAGTVSLKLIERRIASTSASDGDNSTGTRVRYAKPAGDLKETFDAIAQQRPAQVFLGFARFPVAQLADPGCTTQTLVQLADLRYTEPGRSRGTFALELPVDCPNEQLGKMSETKEFNSLPALSEVQEERERAQKRPTIASVRVSPGPYLALGKRDHFRCAHCCCALSYDAAGSCLIAVSVADRSGTRSQRSHRL